MSNDQKSSKELLKSVRRLNTLVIILLFIILTIPLIIVNKEKLSSIFNNEGKRKITQLDDDAFFNELRKDARNFFQSVRTVNQPNFSEAKILLGQKLYYDKRLSKDGNISCNSCHNLNTFGVDNLPTSPGDTDEFGDRNSPTVIYAALHSSQFWDGRAKDVEEQAGMPILNPIEHNIPSEEFLVNRLHKIPSYQKLFKEAFPDEQTPLTFRNIEKAIGAFERQLIPESRFDKWLSGDRNALTEDEKVGMRTFIDKNCVSCHSGVALGGESLQKFGVYGNYWDYTKSERIDKGRYEETQNEDDKFFFKTPSLRNIEMTYPYFHDGSVDSLDQAVRIMHRLQNNKYMNDKEVESIVTFLKSLTADVEDRFKRSPEI